MMTPKRAAVSTLPKGYYLTTRGLEGGEQQLVLRHRDIPGRTMRCLSVDYGAQWMIFEPTHGDPMSGVRLTERLVRTGKAQGPLSFEALLELLDAPTRRLVVTTPHGAEPAESWLGISRNSPIRICPEEDMPI